jgi:DNA-binding CsgD family transcriptional regulator
MRSDPVPNGAGRLSRAQGTPAARAVYLLNRAALDAVRGCEASCRAVTAEAGILGQHAGLVVVEIAANHVHGLLELSRGNLPAALWHLTRCDRMARTWHIDDPHIVRFEPDLVEVLVMLGCRTQASVVATWFTARAARLGLPWSTVSAARCRGMLADDEMFEAEFMSVLSPASTEDDPFELARTALCFGERLRRARRRVEARGPLRHAIEAFGSIGARPWCERAERELGATSRIVRARNDPSGVDNLTPQEEHAARLVAQGATVREAAGRMFLSPKTVEAHLGRTYRKLGVHNRAQLTLALAGRDVATKNLV